MKTKKENYVWGVLRILMGLTFAWPFFDKMFGLGFSTCRDAKTLVVDVMCSKAWINGGSPTMGFLKGSKGPFSSFFQSIAGNGFVDGLFMAGLVLVGLSLIIGIGVRVAAVSGTTMLILMYLAAMPPTTNPVVDDHMIYSVVLLGFLFVNAGDYFGFGLKWSKTKLVKKFPFLR